MYFKVFLRGILFVKVVFRIHETYEKSRRSKIGMGVYAVPSSSTRKIVIKNLLIYGVPVVGGG